MKFKWQNVGTVKELKALNYKFKKTEFVSRDGTTVIPSIRAEDPSGYIANGAIATAAQELSNDELQNCMLQYNNEDGRIRLVNEVEGEDL